MSPTDAYRHVVSWAMAVGMVLCSASAVAGTFTSTHGYTIDYPKEWQLGDSAMSAELEGEADETLSQAGSGASYGVDVVILGPAGDMFTPNLNVVVSPGTTTVAEANVGAVRLDFMALHRQQGGQLETVDAAVATVGGRDAYSLRYEATMPGRDAPLWQWVLIVPNADTTCHFTFSCLAAEGEGLLPTFEEMVRSVRYEETRSAGSGRLPLLVLAACVLFGGTIAVLRRKLNRSPESQ